MAEEKEFDYNGPESLNIDRVNGSVISGNSVDGDLQVGDKTYNENIKGNNNYIDKSMKDDHSYRDDHSATTIENSDFSNGGAFVGNNSSYSNIDNSKTNNMLFDNPETASAFAAENALMELERYRMEVKLMLTKLVAETQKAMLQEQIRAENLKKIEAMRLQAEVNKKEIQAEKELQEKQLLAEQADKERAHELDIQKRQEEENKRERKHENQINRKNIRNDRKNEREETKRIISTNKSFIREADLQRKAAKAEANAEKAAAKAQASATVRSAYHNRMATIGQSEIEAKATVKSSYNQVRAARINNKSSVRSYKTINNLMETGKPFRFNDGHTKVQLGRTRVTYPGYQMTFGTPYYANTNYANTKSNSGRSM